MARSVTTIEVSAPGASSTVPIANFVAPSSGSCKIRRITFGVRAATPVSQGISIRLQRATARGTATTTVAPQNMVTTEVPPVSTGVDTAWSGNPTLATNPLMEKSFNTQALVDLPYDYIEELVIPGGTANGLAFLNIGNAFPSNHTLTIDIEHEE